MDQTTIDSEFLRPLVHGWLNKIESSATSKARKAWKESADECKMFYAQSAAAMWDPNFSKRFWKGVKLPKFRVTINKAFEMVAVFSPNLIWEVPHREVSPKRPIAFPQELFADNPQMAQMAAQVQSQEQVRDQVITMLMDRWLNYTPREQPGGGLTNHSMRAVVDSLLTGRGLLAPRPYKMPGSGRNLTGAFREDPHSLYLDPDFDSIDESRWMAIKHVELYWEVEKKFKLPAGSLKGKASLESSWMFSETSTDTDGMASHRKDGATNDLVVWYEVFSKSGAGCMGTAMDVTMREHLDRTVGQYAYIAICADCPYPLNLSAEVIRNGASDEDVKKAFEWPVPFWADDRWPVEHIDYYIDPSSPWPVAPLTPGLGELKLLNFLMSWFANRTWSSSRDFWAVAAPHIEHYKEYILNGDDQMIIPTPIGLKSPKEAIEILTQPETRQDMTQLIAFVSDMFEKRVGLTAALYGQNEGGTQNRTAEETISKQRAVNARPEYMQKQVVDWQSRVAASEAFVCRWFVTAEDVSALMGPVGAMLWEQYVASTDIESVVRQFNYTIAAASIRRPNRDRDIGNYQQVMSQFAPVLAQYGAAAGNYEPWNGMVREWAELHDIDLDEIMIPPQEQDPEAEAMQQQMLQLQMGELQGKIAKLNAEAESKQADTQIKPMEMQLQQIQGQMQLQMEQLRQQGETMKLQGEETKLKLEISQKQAEQQMTAADRQLEMLSDLQKHRQEMRQDEEKHDQEMAQKEEAARLDLATKVRQTQIELESKKEQAKIQAETAKKKAAQATSNTVSGSKKPASKPAKKKP